MKVYSGGQGIRPIPIGEQAIVHIKISDEDYVKLMIVLGYAAMVAGGNSRAMWVLANTVGNAINAKNPNWNVRWECIATVEEAVEEEEEEQCA